MPRRKTPSQSGRRKAGPDARRKRVRLYLNCTTDYSIVDDAGQPYTIDEAKAAWCEGWVEDYNLGFWRLVCYGWDVGKVREQIDEMDRIRRPEAYRR
jgi:hypothetical protein